MDFSLAATYVVLGLIVTRWIAELALACLNRRAVLNHAKSVPEPFQDMMDSPTYAKSVQYTLAKNRLSQLKDTSSTAVLLTFLLSGVLPALFQWWGNRFGPSVWSMAGLLFGTGVLMALPNLPWDWYAQFRLEEKFGFNTSTQRVWWMDRLKGLLISLVVGYPLLVSVLAAMAWAGSWWWFWAWVCVVAFQLVMLMVAPVAILPLFNKFTPLPDGPLRERLLALALRTSFPVGSVQVMDGSRRSRHSNAFFTGFGRFRKIVLFDTLVDQLNETELEAVLAHEIGHYKEKHLFKLGTLGALALLGGFYFLSVLARQEWFYRAFGFEADATAVALLVFGLLAGLVTFWVGPLANYWSRRCEYQADAFAARVMQTFTPLASALRKLNRENLSNLTPPPIYSAFYYSHPTLLERERALAVASTG